MSRLSLENIRDINKLYTSQVRGQIDTYLSAKVATRIEEYVKSFLRDEKILFIIDYDREKVAELSKKIYPNFKEREDHLGHCIDHFFEELDKWQEKLVGAKDSTEALLAVDGVIGTFHHLGVSLDTMLEHIEDKSLQLFRDEIEDIYHLAENLKARSVDWQGDIKNGFSKNKE